MKIRSFILLLILTSIGRMALAQRSRTDSISSYLKVQMTTRDIPAMQVAVVADGKIDFLAAMGVASLEHNVKALDNTLFYINSITKAFVGVAVMQLSEAGKLSVQDAISKHLDNLPESWRQITIRQLLSHTSGMPDILDEEENPFPGGEEAAWARLIKLPMVSPSGDKFSYNQAGYVVLGRIISKLSGMHFTRFIEERQFKAVGMQRTRFGDSFDVVVNSAGAYTMRKFEGGEVVRLQSPGTAYIRFPEYYRTAAGIMSNAQEVAQWIIALQTGKLISAASLQEMWSPSLLNNGKIGGFGGYTNGYALGWPTVTRDEHPAVAPLGGGRNALSVYLKDNLSIIILTNLMGSNPEQFLDPIAGFYKKDMQVANGFGLPATVKKLHLALTTRGYDQTIPTAQKLMKTDKIVFEEDDLNAYGYQLLRRQALVKAEAIFKLNTVLYPKSANVFDSYGEVNEALGNKKVALESYRKVVALEPGNKNALERIRLLTQ